jgi:hypothetical protein
VFALIHGEELRPVSRPPPPPKQIPCRARLVTSGHSRPYNSMHTFKVRTVATRFNDQSATSNGKIGYTLLTAMRVHAQGLEGPGDRRSIEHLPDGGGTNYGPVMTSTSAGRPWLVTSIARLIAPSSSLVFRTGRSAHTPNERAKPPKSTSGSVIDVPTSTVPSR